MSEPAITNCIRCGADPAELTRLREVVDFLTRTRDEFEQENASLRQELHQAKAEWFEEKKRAREAEQDRDNWMGVAQNNARESARLREERKEMVRQFEADEAAAERDHAELARLREEREHTYWYKRIKGLEAELAGLCSDYADCQGWYRAAKAGLTRLREALNVIEERLSTEQRDEPYRFPSRCQSALDIARNAIEETT